MRALWMQCKIEILRTFRNKLFIFFSLLMPVMFYYIFTNVIQVPQNGDAWKAHYLISMATFSIVGTALFSFGVRISQEKRAGLDTSFKNYTTSRGSVYNSEDYRSNCSECFFNLSYLYRRNIN